ncbi:2-amino-4-hydroxy-6-hydroxymethyldihydropteridine diphosphokinase [Microbulbifer sp. SH-1]|nr:2-amino-4-hydroxy-6-hydroxymethyldihydropteridine diphosphokinase [Microbulbifer sp. SH-1]
MRNSGCRWCATCRATARRAAAKAVAGAIAAAATVAARVAIGRAAARNIRRIERKSQVTRCYIGLGSNLADPAAQLRSALAHMEEIPQTQVLSCSGFYASAPIGPGEQPDYVNAVACVETSLAAEALLDALQAIEHLHGRERTLRWGARTLDLDILLFGDKTLGTARLTVPHPRMAERNFVLEPLAELAPDLCMPDGTPLQTLLARCPPNRLHRLK